MARRKGTLGEGARLADYLTVGYLALNCPLDRVHAALAQCGVQSQRRRGLPHEVLVEGLRGVYGERIEQTRVNKAAISFARTRVGSKPLELLYRSQVGPVGAEGMAGVWYRGRRVMGLDGSTFDVADEKVNAKYFGYPGVSRGQAACPQLRFCALAECGTHTLIGAHCAPVATGEHSLAQHVLSAVDATMWLLADRGFVGYRLWQSAEQTGAKLLFRARHNQVLPEHERLADGSYLSTLYENPKARRAQQGRPVRVIEYQLVEGGEVYRLITNELDAAQAPAEELAALYQRRWKVELALSEVKTQLGGQLALRSKKPELVIQEFYALLIAHAAIRKLMTEAAARSEAASEDLSFVHAVRVLKRRLPAQAALPP